MSSKESPVAIVGAGVAGLAAAWELSRNGRPAVVFEKSRGFSGRAASRSRSGVRYDYGANFFKLAEDRVGEVIRSHLPTEELVEIPGEVRVLTEDDEILPGDEKANAETKWTYSSGISTLGKLLAQAANRAEIVRETQIAEVMGSGQSWRLLSPAGESYGPFEQVLWTLPAPQSYQILKASSLEGSWLECLGECSYHRQFTFVLGYHHEPARPAGVHALVNLDQGHDIAWLSFEEDKPGHVPPGQSVLVVQMAPEWSAGEFASERELLLHEVVEKVAAILGSDWDQPDWWDSQRWKFAHPTRLLDRGLLEEEECAGLGFHFAGDALVGKGRVPLALGTGLEAADRLLGKREAV
ncbi:MAG: FAD-dependent oxidoreductase [Verrucomicrobiota bacterium]